MLNRTLGAVALISLASGPVAAQQTPDLTPYLMTDRAAEVKLARSAAPGQISDSATVMVLTRTGFTEVARGTNGFTCLVLRSFLGGLDDPAFWSPRVRAPNCFNPPATVTVLPEILKRTEWVMAGITPGEIGTRTRKAYASHEFPMPLTGAMAYMLSPDQLLAEENPHWMPHLMLFYPGSLAATSWGAGGGTATVINGSAGDPDAPVLTLLIPVRRWSDGSPAIAGAGH